MSEVKFKLSKNTKWYIYGYTEMGRRLSRRLQEDGCCFCGFIDRNALEYQKSSGDIIISPENINISNQAIIVISCQTVNTQLKIAGELASKGYSNLIFMAAGAAFSKERAREIRKVYRNFSQNLMVEYDSDLYKYDELLKQDIDAVENCNEHISLRVPIELLFTKNMVQTKAGYSCCSEETAKDIYDEIDVPLIVVNDVNSLFELLVDGKGDATKYFKNYADIGKRDIGSCINDRVETFKIWQEELENGIEYFEDAAAVVSWNDRGYFNVIDGVHRSLFLYHKGIFRIPVIMSKSDYLKYKNDVCKISFNSYFDTMIFSTIFRYIREHRLSKVGFLDMYSDSAYFACMAYKFGFENVADRSSYSPLTTKCNNRKYNVILVSDECDSTLISSLLDCKREEKDIVIFLIQNFETENAYGFHAKYLGSFICNDKLKKIVVFEEECHE